MVFNRSLACKSVKNSRQQKSVKPILNQKELLYPVLQGGCKYCKILYPDLDKTFSDLCTLF